MENHQFGLRFVLCTGLLTSLLIGETAPAAAAAYKLTDLGDLGGGYSVGLGINDSGHVTGASDTRAGATHAFLYDGTMHDLGTLGGSDSQGFAINSSGHVVGWSFTTGNLERHAFLYDGVMHDLGTLDAATFCSGLGINDSGRVTGYTFTSAFIYDGTMHNMGTLGGTTAYGDGINASGQVAGGSKITGDVTTHATLWTPTTPNGNTGTMKDLGTLGGTSSAAHGINASGHVAGQSDVPGDLTTHAFLYDGVMHDLGTLGREAFGQGVNAFDQVVGTSYKTDGTQDAFVYSSATGMLDLNTLIDPQSHFQLTYANAINDSGQITGGGSHAYLLTPVPEPTSRLMVSVGTLSLMLRRRRVRRRSDPGAM